MCAQSWCDERIITKGRDQLLATEAFLTWFIDRHLLKASERYWFEVLIKDEGLIVCVGSMQVMAFRAMNRPSVPLDLAVHNQNELL